MSSKLVVYERGFSPSERNSHNRMFTTLCDGMPTLRGCGESIVTSVPFGRPGTKKSGWLITWGYDGEKDDKSYLCAFCPSCAEIVRKHDEEKQR